MKHPLAALERALRRASAPRPPSLADYHGRKMNYTRRRLAYHSAVAAWHKYHGHRSPLDRVSQEAADRAALGSFYSWIVAARAELAAETKVRKAQTALQHRKRSAA